MHVGDWGARLVQGPEGKALLFLRALNLGGGLAWVCQGGPTPPELLNIALVVERSYFP